MHTSISKIGRVHGIPETEEAVKPKLHRLASELSRRRFHTPDSSRDYYLRSLHWLTGIKSSGHPILRLQCLEECAKYFYQIGDKQATLKTVCALDEVARTSGDKRWIRKAQSYKGIARADVGDIYQALESYACALRTAQELGNKSDEAIVLLNMGAALMFAGLYTDSMRCLERALDIGMSVGALGHACSALTNMAQICFRQARYQVGIEYLRDAIKLESAYPPDQYNLHKVIIESNYVQLAIGLGDGVLADQRLVACEEFALRAQTKRSGLIAQLARGLCEVDHGSASAGVAILKAATEAMSPRTDGWVDGHLFLIRGLEKLGDVELALAYADSLTAGLAELCGSGIQALAENGPLSGASLRADQLDTLAVQRSRLEMQVARRQAAQARREAIERLAMAAELRGDHSGLHGHRVGRLSRLFAEHLRLKPDVIEQMEAAGRLHDIGKIAVPDRILHAAPSSSRAEREVLSAHSKIGADLLARSAMPELQCAEVVARHHHERWDGLGYPSKMRGKRIPVECRIVGLVDCLDAMTHGRPHVRPVSMKVALAEIQLQRGKQFDPQLADAFVALVRDLVSEHPDFFKFLESDADTSPFATAMKELDGLLAVIPGGSEDSGPAGGYMSRSPRAPSNQAPESL